MSAVPDIGFEMVSDIVVCILFYNKVEQTLECIQSFLPSGVAIHVFDNGSDPEARRVLEAATRLCPQVRIEGEGRNLGVSGGRNRQIRATTQRWLFFVDNDITIATSDWLERLELAMRRHPVGEVFVPRMFNKHDGTWGGIADYLIDAYGNCTFVASERAFGNSFPGGACVIDRSLFDRCGLYDEDLFVGFEDFELAIRAWKMGMPVLACRCDGIELVHDHRTSATRPDREAAKVRYDVERITRSHRCIQRKHNVLLDPNFSDWLSEQKRQVTGESVEHERGAAREEFSFGAGGHILTPANSGGGRALVLFLPSQDAVDDWMRLRAVSVSAATAARSGIKTVVRLLIDGAPATRRRQWMNDAQSLGLVHEVHMAMDEEGRIDVGSLEGFELGIAYLHGLVGTEFIVRAMQVRNFELDGCLQMMVPELTVWLGAAGTGLRELQASVDPLPLGRQVRGLAIVAASIEQWQRLNHARYGGTAASARDLIEGWLWEGPRWGGHHRVLLGTEVVQSDERHFDGERGPWVAAHWFSQLNMQELTRHQRGGDNDWNSFSLRVRPRAASVQFGARSVIRRLKLNGLTHILLLPWLRRGGADQAALAYLRVLGLRYPGRVLAITTEPVDSPWARFAGEGVQVVEWRHLEPPTSKDDALRAMVQLIYETGATVVHVLNSMLGWQLAEAHGRQLRSIARLYASLFWYGPSPGRRLLGYAADFLPTVQGQVDGYITDNEAFRERLQIDYGITKAETWCVRHPTAQIVESVPVARGDAERRRTVLWASRLAPEKRLDLLLKIASKLDEVRFRVFGAADDSLGAEPAEVAQLRELRNISMEGAYDGFGTLPLEAADGFLYTTSSDGMPNVVVEAAAHGLAVVAPSVGGIGELIDESTGWLVSDPDDADEYCACLLQMLNDPKERTRRAASALARVRSIHSEASFAEQLRLVPGYLDFSCGR